MQSDQSKEQRNLNDAETLADGAEDAAKLMEHMTAMSLKRASGKPNKSVRIRCPTSKPHWFGSFSDEGYTRVKPNRFMCAKISMILATTAMGDKTTNKCLQPS